MNVGQRCCREPRTARPGDQVRIVAERMQRFGVGTIVVVDADLRPLGIVTDRDLALRIIAADRLPSSTRVEDVMTGGLQTVAETESLETAFAAMRRNHVQRLPVVDDDGHLVGIVSRHDLEPEIPGAEVIERAAGDPEC
ncbi:MAG: CBS domain-containing protein [Planctomycetota bacterium]